MLAKFRPRRPSHATVVAYLALFVALGGTGAYAANTIFSTDIVDGEVKTPDLASGAVTGGKVADNSLSGADVIGKPGTSTTPAVNGSLTTHDIAGQQANAANGTSFIDGTLTQWDIMNGTVTGSDVVESSLAKVPDADKLDGVDITEVSRASGDGRIADVSVLEETTVLTANITTARSAALLVSAAVTFHAPQGSAFHTVECHLLFDGSEPSVSYETSVDDGVADPVTMPVVWAHGVGAGPHTVDLKCDGTFGSAVTVVDAGMVVSAHL